MKNSLLFALAALVAAPAIAHADPDVSSDRFRVIHTNTQGDRTWGGGFASQTYAERDIWCIDELAHTTAGLEYDVWVTRLSGSDFSKTKLGNAGAAQYQLAAYMASFYTNTNFVTVDGNNYQAYQLQAAIWKTMGYPGTTNSGGNVIPADRDAIYNYFQSVTIPLSFDLKYWYVVTAKRDCNPSPKDKDFGEGVCNYQEFLTFDPSRPQETVPEPATMTLLATGLAGMAAARRRRKS